MRIKGISFLPTSINVSQLREDFDMADVDQQETWEADLDKEILLIATLSQLSSDKERCVVLLEILREYGYQLDYNSIAQSLGIQLRWLMRVKASVRRKVQAITTNE